uniref:Neuroblast differentiation-associated protein AHNAK-like protein n=1 Tax=Callorhinchus milii TaxID=7868 RepID=A0A4W3JWP0_CALMI
MPSLNLRGPNISGPDGDLGFKVPNIKGVSPKLDGNFKSPTIDVKSPEVDLNVPDTNLTFWDKLKFPKFKKPNLGISEPDVKMPGLRLDTDLPETNIKLPSGKIKEDMKFPKVDVKTPGLDVNVPKPKIKTSTFKLPSLNIKPSKPDVNLKTPKVTGDVDLPKFSIKSPNVDVNKPNIDLHGPSSKMKMPNIGLPSFNTPDLNMKKPDLDLDGKLKMPNFKMKKGLNIPDVDIQGSKGDLGINVPDVNLQSKKFKMPTFNAPGRDLSVPDIDVNLKKPDITDNVNISFPKTKGEFQVPGIDVKKPSFEVNDPNINLHGPNVTLPNVDFDDRKAKIKSLGIKLPSFTPNTKGIDLTAPKLETDFKGPKLDIESPDLDINTPKPGDIALGGNFNIPKFTTPKYSLSGQKGNLPDVDLPGVNIKGDVKPKGIDMKSPKGDIDINMPGAEFKTPNVEMPSFNLRGPNISGPDGDLGFKVPNIKGVSPKLDGNFKSPTIDVKSPEVDLNVPDTNLTFWDKLKFPKFKKPNLETNIKLPSGKMKLPKVDAKIPKLDLKAPNLDIKAPKLDMKTPELDLKTPKLDVKTPKLDMDVNVPKIKTPTLKIPSLNLPGINTSKPDVNLSINADLKSPKIDITPKGNLEGKSQKFKNLFKWSLPKASVPDVNMDLNKPDVNGQLSLPDPKFQGAIKGPNIDLEGKKFDMKAPSAEFQGPKFETPEMNLSPLKASLPDLNLPSLENARSNIKGLKIDGDLSNPKVKGSDFYVNLPKAGITMPDVDINMKAPKISGRDEELDLKSPQVKGNIDLPEPSIKGGVKLPTFNANVPGAGVDVKSSDLKFNDPSLSRISGGTFKVRSASVSDLDEPTNGSTNGLNLKAQSSSTLNINGDTKSKKSRFKLPSLGYKSRGSVDLNKAQVESSKSFGSRFNLPELEFSLTPTS